MSENGIMDRPRRSTRNSLAAASINAGIGGATPSTPGNSNNPYKRPTYYSNSKSDTPSSSKAVNGTPSRSGGTRGRRGRGRPPGRPSLSRASNQTSRGKPECVAIRVDGRRSTGGSTTSSVGGRRGRRSTYVSRQETEYHYGSDFSDQNESDEDLDFDGESDADSVESRANDKDDDNDSDFSVGSSRLTSSRLPSPPVPIWLDSEKVPDLPQLDLPNSSDDLLLSREHVVKAVEIYEPLRRFNQLVRLSPFRFEDFCAALASDDQSALLAEIHIQLLKGVIREEEANTTQFGPNEVKDSIQPVLYFIDHITWPESLRSFLESDPDWAEVHDAMASVEYPFCEPGIRIKVLSLLVDLFLATNAVREQLLGDGTILHEDHCRACNRLGELICCENCPAVYHLECITPPLRDINDPPDDWKCPLCVKHEVAGVNECASEVEKMGLLIRHERLGYDRHGRKYWFLVRRLLVESEDGSEVWYYSTHTMFEELLDCLDADMYESDLVTNIKTVEDEIRRQMEVTEEVTKTQNVHHRRTYLDVENGKEMDSPSGPERMTRLKSTGLYKLGQDNNFRNYVNYYTIDPLALNKNKQNEEKGWKRHMSHKFSLTTASECKYGIKELNGCSRSVQVTALKNALVHMECTIPSTLLHVNWPVLRKPWLLSLQAAHDPLEFSRAMLLISTCIRNAVYLPVWAENAGHVRFSKRTALEREEKKKAEKRDKKDKDDEEERLKAYPNFIKNTLGLRHQVYKQKGEEYRVHGRWGWIWLSNMRRCRSQDCREKGLLSGPHKHVIQVKNEMGQVKTMLIEPSVYSKLMAKRNMTSGAIINTSSQSVAPTPSNSSLKSIGHETNNSLEANSSSSSMDKTTTDEVTMNQKGTQEKNGEACSSDVEMKEKEDNEDKTSLDCNVDKKDSTMEDENQTEPGTVEENKVSEPQEAQCENQQIEIKVETESVEMDTETTVAQSQTSENTSEINSVDNKIIPNNDEEMETEVAEAEALVEETIHTSESNDKITDEENVHDESTTPATVQEMKSPKADDDKENDKVVPDVVAPMVNGEITPMNDDTEEPTITEEENSKKPATSGPVAIKVETVVETKAEADSGSTVTQSLSATNAIPPQQVTGIPAPERPTEDTQIRKPNRTDLINVSGGLASTHRVLFPKIAKRCDYLDSLLQRKLTLKSLEEKQLKSEYGEDAVTRSKQFIAEFEEEERKRKLEEDEYPEEEVIDPNLTLGGAYTMCCYSSDCRNEAKLFMKTKGKNRDRLYEKFCYSPMCRLKFCLQETVRIKQDKIRMYERERIYKTYKELESKRVYTAETTKDKVRMKKLPDCVLAVLAGAVTGSGDSGAPSKTDPTKKSKGILSKFPNVQYPPVSSFQYSVSKKPSILVLSQWELKKLARTAGRFITPAGFFQNQKSGGWGWSLPCGRPVFKTAWQYKTTHAKTLGAVAMQLRILYASIRWDDIIAKIPNAEGKNQSTTETDIITSEILDHRVIGRFLERVQYLRRQMIVPIDAPKTIREITPSRSGLRKRKRAQSPDKTDPIVNEGWVDEERLELWEIRYYGDRLERKGERSDRLTPSASTRTKSGVVLKQPEKFDPSPSHAPGERKAYPSHPQKDQIVVGGAAQQRPLSTSDAYASTIENVIRSHNGGSDEVSAVRTAELMRETIETEMKMGRSVHVSKREKLGNNKQTPNTPNHLPTASQQFQQQQLQQNSGNSLQTQQQKNLAHVVTATPTSSKVGGVVLGKKFFSSRQSNVVNNACGLDTGILTKRPMQSTITINKGVGGSISIVKTPINEQQQQTPAASVNPGAVALNDQSQTHQFPLPNQKVSLTRLPDGRYQVNGLLPGQTCYQAPDGRIHVTVSRAQTAQVQHLQQQQNATESSSANLTPGGVVTTVQAQFSGTETSSSSVITTSSSTSISQTSAVVSTCEQPFTASNSTAVSIQQQQEPGSSQQHTIVNVSTQGANSDAMTSVIQQQQIQTTSNRPILQQQQRHVLIQQANGQQLIFQGPAAQAFLQQQRIQTQRAGQPTSVANPVQVLGKQVQVPGNVSANDLVGRIVLQNGKAVLIQQASPLVNKQIVGSGQQQQIIRAQYIQTSVGQQLVQQGPSGLQFVQSGQQLHIISSQAQQNMAQQETITSSSAANSPGIMSTTSTSVATIVSVPSTPTSISQQQVLVSGSGTTQVKHVLSDGRTVLLPQSSLGDLGAKKVVVGRQLTTATTSPQAGVVAGRQLLQMSGVNSAAVQIIQGPGGQQYILQQTPNTQSFLQQGQQQVQIMMPSGQLGSSQPILVKKFVKSSTGTTMITSSSPAAVATPEATGQTTVQNQLPAQTVSTNADSATNEVAGTQLVEQTGQLNSDPTIVESSSNTQAIATSSSTTVVQQPVYAVKSPAMPTSIPTNSNSVAAGATPSSTPSVVATTPNTQTTITRSPGLPISIVSPSKLKNQQQQKGGVVQVSPSATPTAGSSPSLTTGATVVATPQTSSPSLKSPTAAVVRFPAIPTVIRSKSPSATIATTPKAPTTVFPVNPIPPKQQIHSAKTSVSEPATQVFATKSAAPPLAEPLVTTDSPASLNNQEVAEINNGDISVNSSLAPAATNEGSVEKSTESVPQIVAGNEASNTPSTTASAKPKGQLNKIVAQIYQTPQGPKVIIQGVSPGELSSVQMLQLQQQITKTLAAQQQQKTAASVSTTISSTSTQEKSTKSLPLMNASTPVSQQTPVVSKQDSKLNSSTVLSSAQKASPVESLRSVPSQPVYNSSPLTSPTLIRSPPLQRMVSPAKILSPPANYSSLLSSPKSSGSSTTIASTATSTITSAAAPPLVVARKSAPRKSPITPNNLDSPPQIFHQTLNDSPTLIHMPLLNQDRGVSTAAAELMQPLNPLQEQILADKRNALEVEIQGKKKAAVVQMRLEAQRQIQQLEKAKTQQNVVSQEEIHTIPQGDSNSYYHHQNNVTNSNDIGMSASQIGRNKKKKFENYVVEMNSSSRSSMDSHSKSVGVAGGSSSNRKSVSTKRPASSSSGKKTSSKRKLFCICKTPYDRSRFYVGCDKCDNWYHGECIGITEEMSKDLQEYICEECQAVQPKGSSTNNDELFCICKKPYNESQFYIECDKCEDWFHGRCVGVLPGESNTIGDYSCPNCDPNLPINAANNRPLGPTDYVTIGRVVKELISNRFSSPFRKPVSKALAPNYYTIIKEPMDLHTISIHVEDRHYENLRDFISDLVKIFENCRYYNDQQSDIYKQADNFEKFSVQKIRALRTSFLK